MTRLVGNLVDHADHFTDDSDRVALRRLLAIGSQAILFFQVDGLSITGELLDSLLPASVLFPCTTSPSGRSSFMACRWQSLGSAGEARAASIQRSASAVLLDGRVNDLGLLDVGEASAQPAGRRGCRHR